MIRSPDRSETFRINAPELFGMTWYDYERDSWKGNRNLNVSPAIVKDWIERNVLGRERPTELDAGVLRRMRDQDAYKGVKIGGDFDFDATWFNDYSGRSVGPWQKILFPKATYEVLADRGFVKDAGEVLLTVILEDGRMTTEEVPEDTSQASVVARRLVITRKGRDWLRERDNKGLGHA